MGRYGYALFFALMAGGVAAGIAGVVAGELSRDAAWAPVAGGIAGSGLALLVFTAVLRATSRPAGDRKSDPPGRARRAPR